MTLNDLTNLIKIKTIVMTSGQSQNVNDAMNQLEFEAGICRQRQARKTGANQIRLGFSLLLIG